MPVIVTGRVVDVEPREYEQGGQTRHIFDAWIEDNPRFGPMKVSGPREHMPRKGDFAALVARPSARSNARGGYVSWWVTRLATADDLGVVTSDGTTGAYGHGLHAVDDDAAAV